MTPRQGHGSVLRLGTAGCLASLLLAACSSGPAQHVGAGPRSGPGITAPLGQGGSSAAKPGAKSKTNGKQGSGTANAGGSSGGKGTTRFGSASRSSGVNPANPSHPTGLNAQSVRTLVAQLPKPSARSGPSISYSAPIFMGSSILGDLGSAAWNISHQDADGQLRTWGSGLYVSSTSANALAVMRHSPAVAHYCPRGSTPLQGFNRAGTTTIAVVCPDVHSPGAWWTVFERADRLTYLVTATSDSSRAETVATGTAVFHALTAMGPRINIKLALFKRSAEGTS